MSGSLSKLYGGRGVALARGEGAFVWDSEGKRYIDFFNGHGAALFGHSNPVITEALRDAVQCVWSAGAGFDSPVRDRLAEILGGEFRHSDSNDALVFLCNSGTESIEAALKLSSAVNGKRKEIIACRRAFHGRSCGALGMTFNPKYRSPFANIIPSVKHFAAEEIPEKIGDDTLAVFIEPVQGEGGVYPIPEEVCRAITEQCREKGALLIADEVQCGLGRCGSFFASYERGLEPDIICVAKGLAAGMPAGAVIWRKSLGDFPPHTHGSTYGGNELTARVSVAALTLLKEMDLCAHAKRLGAFIADEISKRDLPLVSGTHGAGLMIGLDTEIPSQDAVRELQKNGLITLTAGPRVLRLLPSFAVTEETAVDAVNIIEETFKDTAAHGGAGR
ncbi:MAG: aspartate aminotransferase family protein [Synergistes sp.]|nr:aspartate aminotransferase family protein [Synergistes sp.]